MEELNYNDERTIKIINWLAVHPLIEHSLLHEGDGNIKDLLEAIEEIEREGFYELVYLLLRKNEFYTVIDEVIRKVFAEIMVHYCRDVGTANMCTYIKETLKKEIELREMKEHTA